MSRKYFYDVDFFASPNPLNSYWAGFIAADGGIYTQDYDTYLKVKLSTKDRCHLMQLQSDIQFTGVIGDYVENRKYFSSQLRICSIQKDLYHDLFNNFNITHRKSLTYSPPNLTRECQLPFIKGLLDGDGQISIYKGDRNRHSRFRVGFSGTADTLEWIKNILKQNLGLTCKNDLIEQGNIYELNYENEYCIPICSLLETSIDRGLDRKWKTYRIWRHHVKSYESS